MQEIAGTIGKRIVSATGNASTGEFIGMSVVKSRRSSGKCIYRICGTNYVLEPEEYEIFYKKGAIVDPEPATTENPDTEVDITSETFSDMLDQSDFFNVPTPDFDMSLPKHAGLLDKIEIVKNIFKKKCEKK